MKKLITAMLALAAIAPLSAQQLPNNGFEEDWVAFKPYSTGSTDVIGEAPTSWNVSNTYGMGGLGKKETSKVIAGHNSASAIEVYNAETGMKFGFINITRVVPGYVTLGTTWATSSGTFKITNTDGGTFGGINFTYQPDALECYYKATGSTASIVAYAWKGSYLQKDVPAQIAESNPIKVDMTDRDRCILGKETSQGGEKSQSEDAALLYSAIYTAKTADVWTRCEVPFKYENNNAKPEKFNVIFCAGDYFDANPVLGRTMSVDDVKLLYYSRLKTITVNGIEANLKDAVFDEHGHCTYDLSESVYMPKSEEELSYTLLGESPAKTVSVALDAEKNTATITVKNTNEGATDVDGESEHVYTIKFKAPRVFTGIEYPGHITTLTWNVNGSGHTSLIEEPVKASVWMTKKGLKRIVDVLLPDFTLPGIGTIGDILVENVTRTYNNNNGNPIYDYRGHVDDLSLAEGGIHAEVDLKGTSDVYGNVSFEIDVKWISNYEELHPQAIVAREPVKPVYIPIKVEFNGTTLTPEVPTGINDVTVDGADAPVEYFNLQGIRVSNPQAGQMVIRRQGTNVEKILVK